MATLARAVSSVTRAADCSMPLNRIANSSPPYRATRCPVHAADSASAGSVARFLKLGAQIAGFARDALEPAFGGADAIEHRGGDPRDFAARRGIASGGPRHRFGAGSKIAAETLGLGAHRVDHVLETLDLHLGLRDQAIGLFLGSGAAGNRLHFDAERFDIADGQANAAVGQRRNRVCERAIGIAEQMIGKGKVGRIGLQPLVEQEISDAVVESPGAFALACHSYGPGPRHRSNAPTAPRSAGCGTRSMWGRG